MQYFKCNKNIDSRYPDGRPKNISTVSSVLSALVIGGVSYTNWGFVCSLPNMEELYWVGNASILNKIGYQYGFKLLDGAVEKLTKAQAVTLAKANKGTGTVDSTAEVKIVYPDVV